MIKALIIDDELNAVQNLQNLLKAFEGKLQIVGTSQNIEEAANLIQDLNPELIFLDIEMPPKNAFELLRNLRKYDFEVIFVTAYSEFGIQAIKFSALDFILKPIDISELKTAVQKAIDKINAKASNASLQNLLEFLKNENDFKSHKIAVSSLKETRFVPVGEIVRCESSNSYTTLFLQNGEAVVSSTPIFEYEEMLTKYGFIRCHQSYFVNKSAVKSLINRDGNFLLLKNNEEIPVSRQKKDFVKMKLME